MNNFVKLNSFDMEFYVMTPVHVGSSDKYAKTDFIYDYQKKRAAILDQSKWMSWLRERNILENYISSLASNSKNFDNFQWLRRNKINDPFIACKNTFLTVIDLESAGGNTLNEIAKHVKDVFLQPYIPGSSIKGAIRSAIITDMIAKKRVEDISFELKLNKLWHEYENKILNDIFRKKDLDFISKDIEQKLMDILFKKALNAEGKQLTDILGDPFRAIRVSDSLPFNKNSVIISKKHDLIVPPGKNTVSEISLWRESIKPGTKTQFSITLDLSFLQMVGLEHIKGADSIMDALSTHRKNVLDRHEKLLTNYINKNDQSGMYDYKITKAIKDYQVITIGGGTGFQNKSLLYALAPDEKKANKLAEKILEIQFPRKHINKDKIASPRTIKTTWIENVDKSKSGRYKLGLCAIKEINSTVN